MANDYFNHSSTLTKHTLARAAQVNSVFESIAAGLDKLPGADPLNQGRVTYVSDTGAADAYVVSLSKAPSSYTAGLSIVMKAANTNTGASTIDVNSLGVKNIKRYDGTDLVANDILASALIHLVYDGTAFRIVGANGAESALAKEWASKTGGTVDGSEHSAKSWAQETGGNAPTAGSAKEWATETSTVDGGLKGARGYAQDASSSASAAATSETNAESHYDTFRGVFYGALSSDPSTDPNGAALDAGDWYFNTTTGTARQYDGSVWKDLGAATLNTFVFTASGGETSLSGADDNGNTLTYTVDFIQVHRNGALLTPDDDYTGSDGSSITGLPAAIAGDVYVIDAFSNLSLANVYTKDEIDEWDPEHATGTDTYVSAENTSPPGNGKTTIRDFQNANTGSTPTLDGRTITDIAGNALWAGALNRVHTLLDDGTNYRVVNPIWQRAPFWAGHIDGLELSNNGTDSDHDIDIATGVCSMRDGSGNRKLFELTSGLTKQIDADWAEGDDAGGFPSGGLVPPGYSLSADTTYHVFLIGKDDGTVDAGFDTTTGADNLLVSNGVQNIYSWFRRIGSVITDGSSNIIAFIQKGDEFLWNAVVSDYDAANPGTSAVLRALTCPAGQTAIHGFSILDSSPNRSVAGLVTNPDQNDTAPTGTLFTTRTPDFGSATPAAQSTAVVRIRTNSSAQIRTRLDTSDSSIRVRGITFGWIDDRGRNA